MNKSESVVAVYHSHTVVEEAIKQLRFARFDFKKLSIVGRDYLTDEHVVGYYNVGDRVKVWGKTGAFWGGLWGFLVGSAFFWIPGVGPILVAGPLVSWIVGALEGAALGGGLGAIGGALASIGIPNDSVLRYEAALKVGKFLLVVHGSESEAARAREILTTTQKEFLELHV